MNYPADFDTPTFPAGKKIISSRLMGIVIMILFLLMLFACGMLFWAQKSIKTHPFLVSVDNITGQWSIVGYNHQDIKNMTAAQSMQESVLTRFVQYWFWISSSDIVNSARWRKCNRTTDCGLETEKKGIDVEGDCAIYCLTNDSLYDNFTENMLPLYKNIANNNSVWQVDMQSIILTPISPVDINGGTWQVQATVYQNGGNPVEILGYAKISLSNKEYQKTLGYYISKFNAYKMN